MRTTFLATIAIPAVLATACGGKYVESPIIDPEAEIRKTDDTEAITDLMENYEAALDALDLEAVRAMVSDEYYENAGTTDTTRDDYGFAGIAELFETLREHVEDLDVDIAVRDVVVEGDTADVLFEYTLRMRYMIAEEAHWETERDVNRFQLQREPAGWRIVSGL